jgi:hypothetical protein
MSFMLDTNACIRVREFGRVPGLLVDDWEATV